VYVAIYITQSRYLPVQHAGIEFEHNGCVIHENVELGVLLLEIVGSLEMNCVGIDAQKPQFSRPLL